MIVSCILVVSVRLALSVAMSVSYAFNLCFQRVIVGIFTLSGFNILAVFSHNLFSPQLPSMFS